jgi:hypothetical protein
MLKPRKILAGVGRMERKDYRNNDNGTHGWIDGVCLEKDKDKFWISSLGS